MPKTKKIKLKLFIWYMQSLLFIGGFCKKEFVRMQGVVKESL